MIIKKYIVSDMKEALVRAKYELGSDAIIIDQRKVRIGKWYNPFKRGLEVTMAIEEKKDTSEEKINPTEHVIQPVIPFYTGQNEKLNEQLEMYCKLINKDKDSLTLEERKDFIKIVMKETPLDKKVELSKINVLIGPTGVGKTTTIAKIAAREYLVNKKKVGLITIDTYRIGAVEQLRTYANILGIELEVVNNPIDMAQKINKLSHCDIILVDTLGTSPKDIKKIEEIKNNLRAIHGDMNTYLVISMSTDRETMASILARYSQLKYDALILTKIDEVSNISNLWFLLENSSFPIQYFCHGQDVPDDIKLATLDNLFDYCEENRLYG
jgi:flagellar biosynthesis protein FlhF